MLTFVVVGEVDLVLHLQAELREGEEREESRHEHGHVEVRVVAEVERREIEGEEALDEEPRQVDALDAEEAASEHDDHEGEKHAWDAPQSLVEFFQKQLVGTDEDALQGTIDHEVPRCTVPQAADQEAEPQVEVFAGFGLHAAAAQGEVEVVLDEHAEGLVPTAPKLGNGGRHIRIIKVFGEFEAHHASKADGHVAVARKVEIDLEGEGEDGNPGGGRVDGGNLVGDVGELGRSQNVVVRWAKHSIHLETDDVGNQNFLRQTDDEAVEALQPVRVKRFAVADLVGDVAVAHDGAGDELRKHDDVKHVVAQALHRLVYLAVGVERVGDALEREERDADRQQDLGPLQRLASKPA